MDTTEDLSARVLLGQIINTEPPRTPITRGRASQSQSSSPATRRSSRRSLQKDPQTPQAILRRSLKHKLAETITRKSLPARQRRTTAVVPRKDQISNSLLFDDGETPRHILRNILQTEPVKSPVVHDKGPSEEQAPPSASSSTSRTHSSIELSALDLPDVTLGNVMSTAKGLSRKRPRRSLNVTAFEKRLRGADDTDKTSDESLDDQLSLPSPSSTSLSLKTPFADPRTEKKGLQRKVSQRRKISEEEFGAAVNKRQMGDMPSIVTAERDLSETANSEGFSLGLSKVSEPDLTIDIVNCNTALYPQPDAMTSNIDAPDSQPEGDVDAVSQCDEEKVAQEVQSEEEKETKVEPRPGEEAADSESQHDAPVESETGVDKDLPEDEAESQSQEDVEIEPEEDENVSESPEEGEGEAEQQTESLHQDPLETGHHSEEDEDKNESQSDAQFQEDKNETQNDAESQEDQSETRNDAQVQEDKNESQNEDDVEREDEEQRDPAGEHISRRSHYSQGALVMPVTEAGEDVVDTEAAGVSFADSKAHRTFDLKSDLELEEPQSSVPSDEHPDQVESLNPEQSDPLCAANEPDADKENSLHPEEAGEHLSVSPEEAAPEGGDGQEEWEEEDDDDEENEDLPSKTPAFVKEKRNFFYPDPSASPAVLKNIETSISHSGSHAGEVLPAAKPKQVRQRKKKAKATLPKSYLMSVFRHFAKTKVSADIYPLLDEVMDSFFERLVADLQTYAAHAKRKTIEVEDAVLLLKRQGYVNDRVPVEVLIEKYLRMEQRKLLIPIATSGNVVIPKKR